MVTFVLASVLITLATLVFLVWPLLFTRNTFSYARHAQNIHYAKERLAELEAQLKNASISATDYEALKLEIETTLAQDIDLAKADQSETSVLPRRPNKAAITAICLLVPLSAAAFYIYVGTPEALNNSQIAVAQRQANDELPSAQEVNEMVANLEQRLIDNPDDLQGWAVLSRTYLALGQFGKASNSLRRVLELGGESAEIYASLADATALAADGDMTGEPTQFADKALQLNPNNRQALWLRGLSAVQSGDKSLAQQHWGKLLGILSDQPQQQAELKQIMAEALGADNVTTILSNTEPEDPVSNNSPTPKPLTINISIAPTLVDQLNPQDAVFVFARAVDGPPAPLAAKRLTVSDLPTTITLSDQDAMVPQFKLSSFDKVSVNARISKSGQAIAQTGDYQSSGAQVDSSQTQEIELVISERVE